MRSLIIRFKDCEGPGIIEDILKNKGYSITFHDAYRKGLELIPESHLIFDTIVLMGGPQSVADPNQDVFFKPYYKLIENTMALSDKKILGICLGSQILAKVLGANVYKGTAGEEIGFSPVKIIEPNHTIFKGISGSELLAFHLHGDTFDIPRGATKLLSSNLYENQMFVYSDNVYSIQCHLEVTASILQNWWRIFKNIELSLGKITPQILEKQKEMEANSKVILENIF